MKPARSVGDNWHSKIADIRGRHFIQTIERADLLGALASDALPEVAATTDRAMKMLEQELPSGFPEELHAPVKKAVMSGLQRISG